MIINVDFYEVYNIRAKHVYFWLKCYKTVTLLRAAAALLLKHHRAQNCFQVKFHKSNFQERAHTPQLFSFVMCLNKSSCQL